jgi:hypothetical protein
MADVLNQRDQQAKKQPQQWASQGGVKPARFTDQPKKDGVGAGCDSNARILGEGSRYSTGTCLEHINRQGKRLRMIIEDCSDTCSKKRQQMAPRLQADAVDVVSERDTSWGREWSCAAGVQGVRSR